MGRRLRGKQKPHQVKETNRQYSDCSPANIVGQPNTNTREVEATSSPLGSSGFLSSCDLRPHIQPITTFAPIAGISSDVLHSGASPSTKGANIISNSTVIEILVHLLCREREPDQARRELLFKALCNGIKKWNNTLYLPLHAFPKLQEFRSHLLTKFEFLFEEVQGQITKDPSKLIIPSFPLPQSGSPLTQLAVTYSHQNQVLDDRFTREFIELSVLGRGGFGVVVKAENKLDKCLYAVKIIIMERPESESNNKLLREVQALAQLSHPNIVRYHSTWLQIFTVPPHLKPKNHENKEFKKQDIGQRDHENQRINKYVSQPPQVKIQELSSSPEADDFEESSGGIVFADVSKSKSPIRAKKINKCEVISESGESSYDSLADIEWRNVKYNKESVHTKVFNCEKVRNDPSVGFRSGISQFYDSKSPVISSNDKENNKILCKPSRSSHSSSSSSSLSNHCLKKFVISYNKRANNAKMTLFIQMGLCDDTLANWISKRNYKKEADGKSQPVDEKVCLDIFRQILLAVQYIHSKNIIHRDLKPQNIFFTEDGRHIQLGDFGLARSLPDVSPAKTEHDATSQSLCLTPILNPVQNTGGVGTVIYAAPELLAGGSYGSRSDMHNLGIILLELFYPFQTGSERARVISDLKSKQYLEPDFMIQWSEIGVLILNLTHRDPLKRPTASELLSLRHFKDEFPSFSRSEVDKPPGGSFSINGKLPYIREESRTNQCVSSVKKTFKLNEGVEFNQQSCQIAELTDQLSSIVIEDLNEVSADSSSLFLQEKSSDTLTIFRLERENKEKDEEIRKLKEEKLELQERVLRLEKQISQNDIFERFQKAASKYS